MDRVPLTESDWEIGIQTLEDGKSNDRPLAEYLY